MSNTDHTDTQKATGDDEDLFDFPRIELTIEGLRDGSFVGSTASVIPPPAQTLASVAAPLPREAVSPAPVQAASTVTTPAAPSIKHVTPAPSTTSHTPITSPPADVRGPSRTRPLLLVAALVALFGLNGAGFFYLWKTRVSLGAGIDEMRNELDDASKRLERARRETAAHATTAIMGDEEAEVSRVAALERSSIVMAENEIFGGEYGAARQRLNKLLAEADRMNKSLRAEIEPRATYLIAKSYLDEARARKGEKK
jgi:hypothetical protein